MAALRKRSEATAEVEKLIERSTPDAIMSEALARTAKTMDEIEERRAIQGQEAFLQGTEPKQGADLGVGPNVFPTQDIGEEVEVSWAKESIKVADYCNCDIGPFSTTSKVRAGENRSDAIRRVYAELERLAEEIRDRKIASFKDALKRARA